MRDWIVSHPTSSEAFNVTFWIGLVGFTLMFLVNKFGSRGN